MTDSEQIVHLNGALLPLADATISVLDRGFIRELNLRATGGVRLARSMDDLVDTGLGQRLDLLARQHSVRVAEEVLE